MDAISKIQSLQLELNRFGPVRQSQASAVQPAAAKEPASAESSPKDEAPEKGRSVSAGLDVEA